MFALLPALQASRMTLTEALHGQMSSTRRGARLRSALVVGQVAVSLVLVITALTLARNGATIGAIDLGFQTEDVISINVRGEQNDLVPRLAAVLASNPRVAEVAVTGGNPLFIRSRAVAAAAAGYAPAVPTRYTFVSPEYFGILRIPMLGGRGFRADEEGAAARVAIVSAKTAKAFWPGESPVGKIIRIERPEGRPVDELPGYSELTVVGLARDVVSGIVFDGTDAGHIYLPIRSTDPKATAVLVRPRSQRDLTPDALQRIFRDVVPDPETFEAVPLEEMRATQVYPLRAASWVGSFLAAVALGLSLSGLYGVRHVHVEPADERNRHPHGARRHRRARDSHGRPAVQPHGRTWRGHWRRGRVCRHADARRHRSVSNRLIGRRRRFRRRVRGSDGRNGDCRVSAGSTCDARGPGAGPSRGRLTRLRRAVQYSAYCMDTSRFRVRPGEMVRLRRRATDDTRPFKHKRKSVDRLKRGLERLVKLQEAALRGESLVAAARLSGDGCRRQRQRDQARDERAEPAGHARSTRSSARPTKSSITITSGGR